MGRISDIAPFAQARLKELRLDDFEQVVSLRLSGQERVFGIQDRRVLSLLWWDPRLAQPHLWALSRAPAVRGHARFSRVAINCRLRPSNDSPRGFDEPDPFARPLMGDQGGSMIRTSVELSSTVHAEEFV